LLEIFDCVRCQFEARSVALGDKFTKLVQSFMQKLEQVPFPVYCIWTSWKLGRKKYVINYALKLSSTCYPSHGHDRRRRTLSNGWDGVSKVVGEIEMVVSKGYQTYDADSQSLRARKHDADLGKWEKV